MFVASVLSLCLLSAAVFQPAYGAKAFGLIGIDIGNEFMKVCLLPRFFSTNFCKILLATCQHLCVFYRAYYFIGLTRKTWPGFSDRD